MKKLANFLFAFVISFFVPNVIHSQNIFYDFENPNITTTQAVDVLTLNYFPNLVKTSGSPEFVRVTNPSTAANRINRWNCPLVNSNNTSLATGQESSFLALFVGNGCNQIPTTASCGCTDNNMMGETFAVKGPFLANIQYTVSFDFRIFMAYFSTYSLSPILNNLPDYIPIPKLTISTTNTISSGNSWCLPSSGEIRFPTVSNDFSATEKTELRKAKWQSKTFTFTPTQDAQYLLFRGDVAPIAANDPYNAANKYFFNIDNLKIENPCNGLSAKFNYNVKDVVNGNEKAMDFTPVTSLGTHVWKINNVSDGWSWQYSPRLTLSTSFEQNKIWRVEHTVTPSIVGCPSMCHEEIFNLNSGDCIQNIQENPDPPILTGGGSSSGDNGTITGAQAKFQYVVNDVVNGNEKAITFTPVNTNGTHQWHLYHVGTWDYIYPPMTTLSTSFAQNETWRLEHTLTLNGNSYCHEETFNLNSGNCSTYSYSVASNSKILNQPMTKSISSNSIDISPNPTSEQAIIRYSLAQPDDVNISVSDITGKIISQLVKSKNQGAGSYEVLFERKDITKGMYFVVMENSQGKIVKKLIIQ